MIKASVVVLILDLLVLSANVVSLESVVVKIVNLVEVNEDFFISVVVIVVDKVVTDGISVV